MCKFFSKYGLFVRRHSLLLALTLSIAAPGNSQAALLGDPLMLDFPAILFDNQGTSTYTAADGRLLVDASPIAIRLAPTEPPRTITPDPDEVFMIDITVNGFGALTGGAPGDDLLITGRVDLGALGVRSGVLLTGEVTGFGFQDSGGPTDNFEFTFAVTGGLLADLYGDSVGVNMSSEMSNFVDDFTVDFDGLAKGTLGELPLASLGDRVWEDLDNDGVQDCTDGGAMDMNFPADGVIGNAGDSGDECSTGIADVEVKLGTPDINGVCVPFNTMASTTITDSQGFYQFEWLIPGDYCVVFTKPTTATHPDLCMEQQDGITYYLGEPQFTDLDKGGNDASDSDADQVTGMTADVTLDFGDANRSLDAGIICPAKIGNFVWSDTNADGLQDGEPGLEDVRVELWECGDDMVVGTADDVYTTEFRTTDASGMYMFGAEPGYDLRPGKYFVKFLKLDGEEFTIPNIGEPDAGEADGDPVNDSDCVTDPNVGNTGLSSCVTLGSGNVNIKRDCGLVVPQCELGILKECRIEPEPTASFDKCDGKLKQFTVVWNDHNPITLSGVNMGGYTTSGGTNAVAYGDKVVFTGPYDSNDVEVSFSGGSFGQSVFHMSCSDDDFNDPLDCGKAAGDGKGESGFDNLWTLEGFIDDSGRVLDCNPENTDAFTTSCEFTKQPEPSCETIKDLNTLTWRYDGGGNNDGDCSGSTFDIQKDFACDGEVDPNSELTVTPRSGSPLVGILPGSEFTFSLDDSKEMTLAQGPAMQDLALHTSCSQPIEVGLTAGALTLVAINGQDGGVGVTYRYTTSTTSALTGITVVDDLLGPIGSPFDLAANGQKVLTTDVIRIAGNTSNIATASSGADCSATSSVVTVTANEPTCDVAVVFDKFEKGEKIKYKITNTSSIVATLDTLLLNFPLANDAIEKVKLDGDIYKASESSLVVGPGDTIDSDDWTSSNIEKRELDPGETRTLEIVFANGDVSAEWLAITDFGRANFKETCSIDFPALPACRLGKPTALTFEYTGNDCGATSNTQEGKFVCAQSASSPGSLVSVTMDKDSDKFYVDLVGNTVTITYNDKIGEKLPSEIEYTITGDSGTQSHVLHTSCSKPLAVDDQFGALILKDVDLAN